MSTRIRVLILEDRSEDAELMVHELRRSHFDPEWRRIDTESEYNAHLGWRPDVILADYNMPLLDAARALELLRELDLDIPFIVVSGAIGEDAAVVHDASRRRRLPAEGPPDAAWPGRAAGARRNQTPR